MEINEVTLRKLIREETRNALKDNALKNIGIADDHADDDIRDLRSLIADWRGIKKVVWQTVAKAGTMFVLGLLMLGGPPSIARCTAAR